MAAIGIFDSGVGGLSILAAIRDQLPGESLMYYADNANLPYGEKTESEIIELAAAGAGVLQRRGCKLVVLACNSVSVAAIDRIREQFPELPIVGVVPMVKPAATLSKTGTIAIFATRATLESLYYSDLKRRFAGEVKVIDVAGEDWAKAIETGQVDLPEIRGAAEEVIAQGADVIVLGCTHYAFVRPTIEATAPQVAVLDSGGAVARQVKRVLTERGQLGDGKPGEQCLASHKPEAISEVASRLTGQKLVFEAE